MSDRIWQDTGRGVAIGPACGLCGGTVYVIDPTPYCVYCAKVLDVAGKAAENLISSLQTLLEVADQLSPANRLVLNADLKDATETLDLLHLALDLAGA